MIDVICLKPLSNKKVLFLPLAHNFNTMMPWRPHLEYIADILLDILIFFANDVHLFMET